MLISLVTQSLSPDIYIHDLKSYTTISFDVKTHSSLTEIELIFSMWLETPFFAASMVIAWI